MDVASRRTVIGAAKVKTSINKNHRQKKHSLSGLAAVEVACWMALRSQNAKKGFTFNPDELWAIFETRPRDLEGVFLWSYDFKRRSWARHFKRGILSDLSKQTGAHEDTIRRRLAALPNLSFGDALSEIRKIEISGKQTNISDLYGKRIGVFEVIADSECRAEDVSRGRHVVAKCVYCGYKKAISVSNVKKQRGMLKCKKCGSGASANAARNMSTAYDSKLMKRKFKKMNDFADLRMGLALGWFSREVGKYWFLDWYVDVMLNTEAKAIWETIHGPSL